MIIRVTAGLPTILEFTGFTDNDVAAKVSDCSYCSLMSVGGAPLSPELFILRREYQSTQVTSLYSLRPKLMYKYFNFKH